MNWTVKLQPTEQEYYVDNTTLERRELTLLISEGNVLKVYVQEPDEYSGLHHVEFVSSVFDMYTGKWLDPRRKQMFLTPDQLKTLGAFFVKQ